MCHRESLKKAQAEIDSVIQPGELPEFEDEAKLPYITAIVKETLRWRDVVPIAVPHVSTVDDVYKGYRLPAGTVVIPNSWAMLHDERYYPDPFSFNPDRFMKDGKLNPDVKDPEHAIWGYGRRVCPGRHLAFSSVWIAVASLITVFDLCKPLDNNGNPIEPTHEYVSGLIVEPKLFKCDFKPRSEAAIRAVRDTANRDYHMH
ncbi:hypothetical protein AX16_010572 [Volvariella volvacea WC 439]|nr:hypothetical protein AX16_010572 [Volvariella volvacea WC 439]